VDVLPGFVGPQVLDVVSLSNTISHCGVEKLVRSREVGGVLMFCDDGIAEPGAGVWFLVFAIHDNAVSWLVVNEDFQYHRLQTAMGPIDQACQLSYVDRMLVEAAITNYLEKIKCQKSL